MRKYSLLSKFIVLFLSGFIISCNQTNEKTSRVSELPYYNEATFTPLWNKGNSGEENELHSIPSFSLTNQDGETVTEKTFEDKIYVTNFFFTTCPGICPKMTANLSVLQEEFLEDDEILLLSHSATPEIDSVEVLKSYAEKNNVISGKWHLVTGNRNEIYELGRNQYFVEEDLSRDKTDDEFLHTENFVLVDKNKHIRGIYNGLNKTAVAQLIADIKTLKTE
ncbi:SCO family protein [Gramella sp. AN32]|nr:SCO family protein [Gramella sp. AN32]